MLRKPALFCWSALLVLTLCVPTFGQDSQDHSQDQPSLGDAARQARSQKSGTSPKKVVTNDDISSASGLGVFGLGAGGSSGSAATPGGSPAPSQDLDKVESAIAKLDTIDQASLVKLALQGSDVKFPGRAAWEQRLAAARQDYVAQLRDLVREARQLEASAKILAASKSGQASENDPDVLRFKAQIKQLAENAVRIDAAFQAVVVEGRNRAAEAAGH
jgi:hypothetical protein